jgi:hypothetical protein
MELSINAYKTGLDITSLLLKFSQTLDRKDIGQV